MTTMGEAGLATRADRTAEPWLRRTARAVLRRAVRGRAARGSDWGEAMLAEFEEIEGWESVRWAMSGALTSWRQRHGGRSLLATGLGALVPRRRPSRVVAVLLVAAVLSGLFFRFVVSFGYAPSGSMEPTVQIGERFLIDHVGFRFTGLRHGDIVVYAQDDRSFVKRVVGLAGDRIECLAGTVRRNGQPVDEPYLAAGATTECSPVTVPAGSLYLLGDHRLVSQDSRQNGPVDADTVGGRYLGQVWPFG